MFYLKVHRYTNINILFSRREKEYVGCKGKRMQDKCFLFPMTIQCTIQLKPHVEIPHVAEALSP